MQFESFPLKFMMCRSYYTVAQPATNNDVVICKVLSSISIGSTRRLRLPCGGHLTARSKRTQRPNPVPQKKHTWLKIFKRRKSLSIYFSQALNPLKKWEKLHNILCLQPTNLWTFSSIWHATCLMSFSSHV